MRLTIHTLILISSILLTSCVSTKKYDDLQAKYVSLQGNKNKVFDLERENQLNQKKLLDLQAENKTLKMNLEEALVLTESQRTTITELTQRYNALLERNEMLLKSSSTEIRNLSERLAKKEDELFRRQRDLDQYQKNLNTQETDFSEWKAKVNDLQKALYEKDARINELQRKISLALSSLSAADLSVTPRDGRLYVSLSQNLLFDTGSDRLKGAGISAIQQLASILQTNTDMEIAVEGHTDNLGGAETNWRLSTSRANTVIKILTDAGVNPARITASGRAFYHPIAPNDSEENRAKNRRVEIILTPKLDELYRIIK